MSTRSSILSIGGVHIYHEWSDEGFIYVNTSEDAFKLCSAADWLKIVKYIKENEKDVNGKDLLKLVYE